MLDVQECPQADVAICALVADVLERLAGGHWGDPTLLEVWDTGAVGRIALGDDPRRATRPSSATPTTCASSGGRPRTARGGRALAASCPGRRPLRPLGRSKRAAGGGNDSPTRTACRGGSWRPSARPLRGTGSRPSIENWPIAWRPEGCSPALSDFVLLTCEHGGNRVPAEFARLFRGQRKLLDSHRGYDPGALELARTCARRLNVPLHFATVTRLLVELNRSPKHPAQFSIATKLLSAADRESLFVKHYYPYRNRVEAEVETAVGARPARDSRLLPHVHAASSTETLRRADIGLFYDPRRPGEAAFCALFKQSLASRRPDLTIRKNYPYLGKTDGFTTTLRKKWNDGRLFGNRTRGEPALALGRPPQLASLAAGCGGGSRGFDRGLLCNDVTFRAGFIWGILGH